jgi:hypothetical protein
MDEAGLRRRPGRGRRLAHRTARPTRGRNGGTGTHGADGGGTDAGPGPWGAGCHAARAAPTCPWSVFLLSLPALAATLALLRQRAPTRLRAAGAAAGLFAGALGAAGYALSCTEESAAFVAVWYTLGIVLSTALGALLGPRVLRW